MAVNAIMTSMVAVSFGGYASDAFTDSDDWVKLFAVLVLMVMTGPQRTRLSDRRVPRRSWSSSWSAS